MEGDGGRWREMEESDFWRHTREKRVAMDHIVIKCTFVLRFNFFSLAFD